MTGFDDFETSRMLPRRIRIVDYDTSALGTVSATTLLDRIAGVPRAHITAQLLPTRLVDRGMSRLDGLAPQTGAAREITTPG